MKYVIRSNYGLIYGLNMKTKTKQLINDFIKKYSNKKNLSYGFLGVYLKSNKLILSYSGNMRSGISEVNECLKAINLPTVENIRAAFPKFKEIGWFDYLWTGEIKFK